MPVRTRRRAVRERALNGLSVFKWSLGPIPGLESLLNEPVYESEAAARRGWETWRRRVWGVTHRFRVPLAAEVFDGLTLRGLADVYRRWNEEGPFDPTPTLRLLAEDHAAILRFEQTRARAARAIADYLATLREDLAAVDRTARALAAFSGDWWRRPCPYHSLSTSALYRDGSNASQDVDVD